MRALWPLALGASIFISGCGGSSGGSSQPNDPPQLPAPVTPMFSYDGTGILLNIPVESDNSVNVISGEVIGRPVTVAKAEESIPVEITLLQPVTGVTLETMGESTRLLVDSNLLSPGNDYDVTVVARNTEKDESINQALVVRVIESAVIATGTLPSSGGSVVSADGSFGVSVNAGELTQNYEVEISRAVTPAGLAQIRVRFDPDISAETGVVKILHQAQGNASDNFTSIHKNQFRMQEAAGANETAHIILSKTGVFAGDNRLANFESAFPNWFATCSEVVADIGSESAMCFMIDPQATSLESAKPESYFDLDAMPSFPPDCEETDCNARFQPVIFVHGFDRSGNLSGSAGTWGEFQSIVNELEAPAPDGGVAQVVSFDFRWRTNASFRLVADDLAASIIRVNELTGSPVHIVAHSFGGVLVRTLLKDETFSGTPFDSVTRISTVLTLGTPHSGIYAAPESGPEIGFAFPDGRDSLFIGFCTAISCWQMGDSAWPLAAASVGTQSLYDAGERGQLIDRISALPITDVPLIVAIGLSRRDVPLLENTYHDGDKLISFDGQRVHPELVGTESLLRCVDGDGSYGQVTEIVMGPLDDEGRSVGNPRPFTSIPNSEIDGTDRIFAYSHSGDNDGEDVLDFLEVTAPDPGEEYGEPYVERCDPSNQPCEPHAALEIFKRILSASDPFGQPAYCITPVHPGTPTAPELIAAGGSEPDTIQLEWTAAVGGIAPIEYQVYDDTDSAQQVFLEQTSMTSYTISGVPQDGERCFVIVAIDASGLQSDQSNRGCTSSADRPDAEEGWLKFETGDPGIPNDGLSIPGVSCPVGVNCTYREFTLFERIRLGPNNSPITISVFDARFGFSIRFGLVGFPSYCSSEYGNPFANGDTPPYDGVEGRFLVIDETIFADGVDHARNRHADCMAAPASAGYISRIVASTGGRAFDGAYLAYGVEVFPDDGLPPIIQTPGWVSFVEGVAGVPDDGVLVQGLPPCQGCDSQHTIVEEFVLGPTATGLTLSVYGSDGEALEDVVLRFRGFPEVCEFRIPTAGQLPNAPRIGGVDGKYISLARGQMSTQAQLVSILHAGDCANVSVDDVYYAAFILSGNVYLVDGAYVGIGQNEFPDVSP